MNTKSLDPTQRCRQPKRYKLALLTFFGLLAPVYFVPPALMSVFNGPRFVVVSMAVGAIVLLMTYIIMPIFTHLTARWLFEHPGGPE